LLLLEAAFFVVVDHFVNVIQCRFYYKRQRRYRRSVFKISCEATTPEESNQYVAGIDTNVSDEIIGVLGVLE